MFGLTAAPEIAAAIPRLIPPPRNLVRRYARGRALAGVALSLSFISSRMVSALKPEYKGVKMNDWAWRSWYCSFPPELTFSEALTMGYGPWYPFPARKSWSGESSQSSNAVNGLGFRRFAFLRSDRDAPR